MFANCVKARAAPLAILGGADKIGSHPTVPARRQTELEVAGAPAAEMVGPVPLKATGAASTAPQISGRCVREPKRVRIKEGIVFNSGSRHLVEISSEVGNCDYAGHFLRGREEGSVSIVTPLSSHPLDWSQPFKPLIIAGSVLSLEHSSR